ncbi:hypothetical protein JZ751_021338 [Albula glossodonta]|uniref:Gastric inhibitory polypeptide receptor n=1 Tax=Albula glossodonta TaxID=121402 RepID=A0A8T2NSJ0_9TELE|nr:hypothetical protein JZ751_021338 [Albula glossodonta]
MCVCVCICRPVAAVGQSPETWPGFEPLGPGRCGDVTHLSGPRPLALALASAMWANPASALLTVFILCRIQLTLGKTVKDTVEEWNKYRSECEMKMKTDPFPTGLFCQRMFDMYACWTDGVPNSTVRVPCPWYLPWHDQVRNGFVLRECGPDGQWVTNNTSLTWRDHSQCNADDSQQSAQENQMMILAYFRVMYTVGYSLSLSSLSLALVILLIFRKLRCTRNYIHTNLFASFILRAISILTRDALLMRETPEFRDNRDVSNVLSDKALSGCRVAQVLMQYCVGANYYWLLVEGLYLHNLLVLMVFSENSYFSGYLVIGWGTPVLFVIPWIVVRYLYENTRCWEINENMAYWWIIRSPILLAILVVFAVMTEEQTEGTLRNVNLFFELFFNSFQGLLVAILYCFVNKEVQSEIKKKWQRWKLGMSVLEEQRNTCSNTPQGGAAGSQCQHEPPCQPGAEHPDCNTESHKLSLEISTSSQQQHHHPGAKKGKSYCYISARKQVPNGTEGSQQGNSNDGTVVRYSESYC